MMRIVVPGVWSLAIVFCGNAQEVSPKVHQTGDIRIHYHLSGEHAVDPADANANGVPDQVEDVMTQVLAARMVFVEVLGFPEPMKTERFRTASFIDIHLRSKDVLKMNGVAYDELQRYQKPGDPEGTLSIGFSVATSVKAPGNLTPAHEFFHLIQYSTTYFKNRWFLEGTARWSERALGTGDLGPARLLGSWPLSQACKTEIEGMTYEASEHLWNPLAKRMAGEVTLPDSPALDRLRAMRYTDGSPVLKDDQLAGSDFIREVVSQLGHADDRAFQEQGYDRWSEENQRSEKNPAYLWGVIEAVVGSLWETK